MAPRRDALDVKVIVFPVQCHAENLAAHLEFARAVDEDLVVISCCFTGVATGLVGIGLGESRPGKCIKNAVGILVNTGQARAVLVQ